VHYSELSIFLLKFK